MVTSKMMKKLSLIVFIFLCTTNCSTKKVITLKQISTDKEIVIKVDTIKNIVREIRFPFVFEFTNPFKEGKRIESPVYSYHSRYYPDSLIMAGLEGWLSNGC